MVDENNRYAVDQTCSVTAIDLASHLGLVGMLRINFLPGTVYKPGTNVRATLEAATEMKLPTERLMFEVKECEQVVDHAHQEHIFVRYRRQRFTTATISAPITQGSTCWRNSSSTCADPQR